MRVFLAWLMALSVLVNPVMAAPARALCANMVMAAPAWPSADTAKAQAMCCDQDRMAKDCAQRCAIYCGVTTAVLPARPETALYARVASPAHGLAIASLGIEPIPDPPPPR